MEQVGLVKILGLIMRLGVRIAHDTELVLVDLVSRTARNVTADQEATLLVPPRCHFALSVGWKLALGHVTDFSPHC
jgi:hypothetical protein